MLGWLFLFSIAITWSILCWLLAMAAACCGWVGGAAYLMQGAQWLFLGSLLPLGISIGFAVSRHLMQAGKLWMAKFHLPVASRPIRGKRIGASRHSYR